MKPIYILIVAFLLSISCKRIGDNNPLLDQLFIEIEADKDSLYFGDDSEIVSMSFNLVNRNLRSLEWNLEYSCQWIDENNIFPGTSGLLKSNEQEPITININRDLMNVGYNSTFISIISPDLDKSIDIKVSAIVNETRLPILETLDPTDVLSKKATLHGKVLDPGFPPYFERGFVVSKTDLPSIGEEGVVTYEANTDNNSEFSVTVSVVPNTTYFVRSYAKNSIGTTYGNDISFETSAASAKVITSAVSDITTNSAVFNGIVVERGDPGYTEKGFCYTDKIKPTPEISDTKLPVSGLDDGPFSCKIDGLEIDETYYVRAYLIQNGNVIYGEVESFSTIFNKTEVATSGVSNITSNSATFNGIIVKKGNPGYAERGFCYSDKNPMVPEITDRKISVDGLEEGPFSYDINGLNADEQYYVRSYAIQNGEIIYGEVKSFTTTYNKMEITTLPTTGIGADNAQFNAQIISAGEPPYTERGFCYSAYPDTDPDIYDNKISVSGDGIVGKYQYWVKSLSRETLYYVKAYAIQNGDVVYGNTVSFTTIWDPSVVKNEGYSNQILGSIQLNASIINEGNPKYTEKGFVYRTMDAIEWYESGTPEFVPDIYDVKVPVSSKPDGNRYSLKLTGLNGNKICGFRPYLIQDDEVVYGETEYFLNYTLPDVVTLPLGKDPNDPSRVQLNGYMEWTGNPQYSEIGFVVSDTNPMPELGGLWVINVSAQHVQGLQFASVVSGIKSGQTIYIRAYAKSSIGVSYGDVVTYTN